MSRVSAYLQLLRAPATPTAVSNVVMGYLVANGAWTPVGPLLALILASALIYSAGMIFNDVADIEEDRAMRASRPLPSGRVQLGVAKRLGWTLLVAGIAAAAIVGWANSFDPTRHLSWRCAVIASILSVAVIAYDFWLKRTWSGPLVLGGCRSLNVLLGMSTGIIGSAQPAPAGFSLTQWSIAAGVGIYITGLSLLARREAETSRRISILVASFVLAVGLSWLAIAAFVFNLPTIGTGSARANIVAIGWMALIAFPIAARITAAWQSPTPARVQRAVTTCLFSLIWIDAILCFIASGGRLMFGVAVAALILPSLVLSRWARAT